MMDRKLGDQDGRNLVAFEGPDMARGLAEINRVDDQDPVTGLEQGEQVKTHGPPINELHGRRTDIPALKGIEGVNPDSFIGKQNIAEA
jgi:hypothetical protein